MNQSALSSRNVEREVRCGRRAKYPDISLKDLTELKISERRSVSQRSVSKIPLKGIRSSSQLGDAKKAHFHSERSKDSSHLKIYRQRVLAAQMRGDSEASCSAVTELASEESETMVNSSAASEPSPSTRAHSHIPEGPKLRRTPGSVRKKSSFPRSRHSSVSLSDIKEPPPCRPLVGGERFKARMSVPDDVSHHSPPSTPRGGMAPRPAALGSLIAPESKQYVMGQGGWFRAAGHSLADDSGAGPPRNHDRFTIASTFRGDPSSVLFGLFTGHGPHGWVAAANCCPRVTLALEKQAREVLRQDPEEALQLAFMDADMALGKAPEDMSLSGTTATIVLIQDKELSVGWVGDSRVIVGREAGGGGGGAEGPRWAMQRVQAEALTWPHVPEAPAERDRIVSNGGKVGRMLHDEASGATAGPVRIFEKCSWTPGLSISRSLGDSVGKSIGMSSIPDVTTRTLDDSDRFLVIGTNALVDTLGETAIMEIVSAEVDPAIAAQNLIEAKHACCADAGGCETVLVVYFNWRRKRLASVSGYYPS